MARTFPRRTADHSIIIERLVLFFTSPRTRLIRASPSISVFPSFRPGLFGHVRDDIRKWTESVSTNNMSQTVLGLLSVSETTIHLPVRFLIEHIHRFLNLRSPLPSCDGINKVSWTLPLLLSALSVTKKSMKKCVYSCATGYICFDRLLCLSAVKRYGSAV